MPSEVIFDTASIRSEIAELEGHTHQPGFWDSPSEAQATMRKIAALKDRVEPYERLRKALDDIEELRSLVALEAESDPATAQEIERLTAAFLRELDEFELRTLLGGEHDASNAIVEIGAGAGGTEACDWARMLFRMYARWAERKGYDFELLSETPGDVTGYRNVAFKISGPYAYGYLRSEHGVHRLVRISPFDAAGKRHTSFAMVNVMPEVAESDVNIAPEDLKIETFRSSGAGGQHVNKTESAIRITHIPTNIVVTCQNERSQHKNRSTAMTILLARLAELERHKSEETLRQLRGDLTSADWGRQIRSYVLQPYSLVKDLRTNFETGNVQAVLDGEIDELIGAFLRHR